MKEQVLKEEGKQEDYYDEEKHQFLTFVVGNETYGIEVGNIREVIHFDDVFPIPAVPQYIRGVINLRGDVVPVIDLSYRFYQKKSEGTKFTSIVISEVKSDDDIILIGFVIDSINAVIDIPAVNIEHTPEFGSKIRHDFIEGVGKTEEGFIIILNIDKVLNIDELADFDSIAV